MILTNMTLSKKLGKKKLTQGKLKSVKTHLIQTLRRQQNNNIMKYLFTLGHQPHLSAAEIEAVFQYQNLRTCKLAHMQTDLLLVETKEKLNCEELIKVLGGTIKIAEKITGDIVKHLIKARPEGKIEFSIADKKRGLEIKKELKTLGHSARYIEPKNTATILHSNLVEKQSDFTIIDDEIFATRAIQDIENFTERDFGRPGADSATGMLPPKLARIMINLGLAGIVETQNFASLRDITILDPFCGSGTILTEAISMGFTRIFGSDISDKAISDTKKNINWLISKYELKNVSYTLHESSVLNLSDKLRPSSVDLIITEPHLGKPLRGLETREFLVDQARSLAELYLNAFHVFYRLLKPGGNIVMVFPKYQYKNEWIRIEILEKIKKIGFEAQPPLTYHRPTQHLAKEIWRFKKI